VVRRKVEKEKVEKEKVEKERREREKRERAEGEYAGGCTTRRAHQEDRPHPKSYHGRGREMTNQNRTNQLESRFGVRDV